MEELAGEQQSRGPSPAGDETPTTTIENLRSNMIICALINPHKALICIQT